MVVMDAGCRFVVSLTDEMRWLGLKGLVRTDQCAGAMTEPGARSVAGARAYHFVVSPTDEMRWLGLRGLVRAGDGRGGSGDVSIRDGGMGTRSGYVTP